jgi:hypothetical protein
MATRKVTINLPEDQIQFLQDIAKKESVTFTDVLRRAINSEKFFVQQEGDGNKVLIEDSAKRIREIVRK